MIVVFVGLSCVGCWVLTVDCRVQLSEVVVIGSCLSGVGCWLLVVCFGCCSVFPLSVPSSGYQRRFMFLVENFFICSVWFLSLFHSSLKNSGKKRRKTILTKQIAKRRMFWLPPPPVSPEQISQPFLCAGRAYWRKKGGGGGAKPYNGEKAWSSLNHSIFSGSNRIAVTCWRKRSQFIKDHSTLFVNYFMDQLSTYRT